MDEITLYDSNPRQTFQNCCNMLDALAGAVSHLHEGATEGECLALSYLATNVKRALEQVDVDIAAKLYGHQPTDKASAG